VVTGIFWAVAGAIALVVVAVLIKALRQAPSDLHEAAEFDRQVYRDQLREIERDKARGVIGPDEAQRLHSEVARRLLEADRALSSGSRETVKTGPNSAVTVVCVALVVAAGFGLYQYLGAPGTPDQPLTQRLKLAEEGRADRPTQAEVEASLPPQPPLENVAPEFEGLVQKLRDAVAGRPDDLQGQLLLARNEANLGNFAAAYKAQERVIALKGDSATIDDKLMQATLMIQAAGGKVSPEAEAIFRAVLNLAPENDTALFFGGIVNMQVGRADVAFGLWKKLVETAPADSRWLTEVRPRMAELADLAGVRYSLPESTLPGPSAEDMQAAEGMSPEDRQAMIRGMVEGLNDRLATEGGTAEEWARLIVALANLDEADRARAIWQEAQTNFAGREAELATIRVAAQTAGLTE
jgi:cytochrome c-type biogenesis protein CcmH